MISLYSNIKSRRIELGMSQEELAHKVGYTDRTSIAKIEAGKVDIPQSKIIAFAKALNISAADLMGWDDDAASSFSRLSSGRENVVRIACRDGSYIEKKLSDDQVSALKMIIDQLPEADDL